MGGELKGEVALCLVASLDLESAGRQRIHHVDSDKSAVRASVFVGVVANPPKIVEIAGKKVIPRRDLCGAYVGHFIIAGQAGRAGRGNSRVNVRALFRPRAGPGVISK